METKIAGTNRKARHLYTIIRKMEVGIGLKGTEVKSLRNGKVSLAESYARVDNGELFLYNMHISPYEYGSYANKDPLRKRKLLAHKKEIAALATESAQKGKTLVPLRIYFNEKGIAKLELALASGKKMHDKRDAIKRKTMKREIERQFRGKAKL